MAATPANGTSTPTTASSARGLPSGAPEALYRSAPELPVPRGWPFGNAFSSTSGYSRLAAGAIFWTGFPYDDHGARGIVVAPPVVGVAPSAGTFSYPAGPSDNNGANIARAAVGVRGGTAWWRVDWTTLADATIPIAMWAVGPADAAHAAKVTWPAGATVTSAGAERWILVSSRGAWLLSADGSRHSVASVGGGLAVDMRSKSFVVSVPRSAFPSQGSWRVQLGAGLADATGSGFAAVSEAQGALPSQPPLYDVAFRTDAQEPVSGVGGSGNWWRDEAQANALAIGDINEFALAVSLDDLGRRVATPEPDPAGWSNRWYLSSSTFGPGVTAPYYLNYNAAAWKPNFLGSLQPYGIYVPRGSPPSNGWGLAILLHAINFDHNEFGILNSNFIQGLCEQRRTICVAPLGRGADGWWANEAELDVWEVWNRVAAAYPLDPNRTVLAGYSMGGYGAYRLGLEHPDLFAADLALAGAPACAVTVVQGVQQSVVPGLRDCDSESDTKPLIGNARELPFYIGTDALDELAPASAAVQLSQAFDSLADRYRLEIYDDRDHASWAATGAFEGALSWLEAYGWRPKTEPAAISYRWYAYHQDPTLGTGPGSVFWVTGLQAAGQTPGFIAGVEATSHMLPAATPMAQRSQGALINSDGPAEYLGLGWTGFSPAPPRTASLDLSLHGAKQVELEMGDAGFPEGTCGTVNVNSDGSTLVVLDQLRPGTDVTLLGRAQRAGSDGAARIAVASGISGLQFCGGTSAAAMGTALPNTGAPHLPDGKVALACGAFLIMMWSAWIRKRGRTRRGALAVQDGPRADGVGDDD